MLLKDPVVPSATGYTRDLTLKSTGPDVVAIQTRLGISTKGGFGTGTEAAVKSFQKKYKLSETGVVDKTTFDKIMAMPPAGTAAKYSGKKHNYTEGQWILVSPKTDDTQLSGNNGYFKIIKIVNEYSVQIDATFVADGPGGSTQRVLFGEDAKQGTQEVIKSDGDTQDNSGTGRRSTSGDNSSGRRSGTGSGTVDPEKQRQRDIRNKEFCDTLRQIKQYLNNTKEADLTVNCKKTQKTINQIMMALSPETPVAPIAPIEEPNVTTPRGNVRIY
jgi:peptidoglycan hydrolase-like protein with peptidoglycan-binding domain